MLGRRRETRSAGTGLGTHARERRELATRRCKAVERSVYDASTSRLPDTTLYPLCLRL